MTHLERWQSWHSCSSRYRRPSEHSTAFSRLLQCGHTWTGIRNNPASWCRGLGVPRYRPLHPSRHPSEKHTAISVNSVSPTCQGLFFLRVNIVSRNYSPWFYFPPLFPHCQLGNLRLSKSFFHYLNWTKTQTNFEM